MRETFLTCTPEDLRQIADHLEAHPEDLCHLYQTPGNPNNIVTFRTRKDL